MRDSQSEIRTLAIICNSLCCISPPALTHVKVTGSHVMVRNVDNVIGWPSVSGSRGHDISKD
jgi:hypothetical protein